MTRDEEIKSFTMTLLMRSMPQCQEECCAISAIVDVKFNGIPADDFEIIARAERIADGLFGSAYHKASEYQRIEWINMCEVELRKASGFEKI